MEQMLRSFQILILTAKLSPVMFAVQVESIQRAVTRNMRHTSEISLSEWSTYTTYICEEQNPDEGDCISMTGRQKMHGWLSFGGLSTQHQSASLQIGTFVEIELLHYLCG